MEKINVKIELKSSKSKNDSNENEWQNPINQNKRKNHKYIDKTINYVVFYNIPPPIQKKVEVE